MDCILLDLMNNLKQSNNSKLYVLQINHKVNDFVTANCILPSLNFFIDEK